MRLRLAHALPRRITAGGAPVYWRPTPSIADPPRPEIVTRDRDPWLRRSITIPDPAPICSKRQRTPRVDQVWDQGGVTRPATRLPSANTQWYASSASPFPVTRNDTVDPAVALSAGQAIAAIRIESADN
jgi:hypothetical protein